MTQPVQTPNPATVTRPRASSRRVAHRSPFGWLPWLLLALLALLIAAVVWALVAADDDDSSPAARAPAPSTAPDVSVAPVVPPVVVVPPVLPSTAPSGIGTPAAPPAVAPPPAAVPDLRVGEQDLLALSGGPLTGTPSTAVAGTATVQSVVSDSGFWVGSSPTDRVFVWLTLQARGGRPESPFEVTAGQTVMLTGTLTPLPDPDVTNGVTVAEGLPLLQQQGAFVAASTIELSN